MLGTELDVGNTVVNQSHVVPSLFQFQGWWISYALCPIDYNVIIQKIKALKSCGLSVKRLDLSKAFE